MRTMRKWKRLTREVVQSPAMEISNVGWTKTRATWSAPAFNLGFNWMTTCIIFQSKPSHEITSKLKMAKCKTN